MTEDQILTHMDAEFRKMRESFRPSKFWDVLVKASAVALVAVVSFVWGLHLRVENHETRLAIIESSRFTGEDGRALERALSQELRPELEGIKGELQNIRERLATLEARGGPP